MGELGLSLFVFYSSENAHPKNNSYKLGIEFHSNKKLFTENHTIKPVV